MDDGWSDRDDACTLDLLAEKCAGADAEPICAGTGCRFVGLFLNDLLGDKRLKAGWMRAEVTADPGPLRQQVTLGQGRWDADELCDVVRDYVVEHLGTEDAVLVIDATDLKHGKTSCDVVSQRNGSAGKVINCQSVSLLPTYLFTVMPS